MAMESDEFAERKEWVWMKQWIENEKGEIVREEVLRTDELG